MVQNARKSSPSGASCRARGFRSTVALVLPPPLPHQVHVLQRVLDRVAVASADGGPIPIVVFGLDGTLYDNRPRTLQILLEYSEDVRSTDLELSDALSSLSLERIHRLLSATLRECDVVQGDVVHEITNFWHERFFSDDYATLDHPIPGAPGYVRALHEAGAMIVYVSGRDIPGMMLGTLASLRDDGFPVCAANIQAALKPDATQGDESFKRKVFRQVRKLGDVIAVFDAAPGICDTARGFFPEAEIAMVDTWRLEPPDPEAQVDLVGDFRMG